MSCKMTLCLCAGVHAIHSDIVFVFMSFKVTYLYAGVRVIQGDVVFVCRCSCHSR